MSVKTGRELWAQRHPAKQTTTTTDPKPLPLHNTLLLFPPGTKYVDPTGGGPNPWRERRAAADWQAASQADNVH
ncbi:hypothetical protein ACWEU6_37110 [Streptosporangium sandarakinum]|uniref:hypothetical protein n=1 Tax=Streptosporangium sandarakinum TaxID=1260955 RepID=UPI0036CD4846